MWNHLINKRWSLLMCINDSEMNKPQLISSQGWAVVITPLDVQIKDRNRLLFTVAGMSGSTYLLNGDMAQEFNDDMCDATEIDIY